MNQKVTVSNIRLHLQKDGYRKQPFPKSLHGLCYHLAGEDYPHHPYHPPKFHPYIAQWRTPDDGSFTKAIIEIRSIDDKLTKRMLENLRCLKRISLGNIEYSLTSFDLKNQQTINLNKKLAIPVPEQFKIKFVTSTKFRTKKPHEKNYQTIAYPSVKYFIRSIARKLNIWYGIEYSLEEQEELADAIDLIHANAYPLKDQISPTEKEDDGFIGEIQLSCANLTDDQKRSFGLLLQVAKHMGTGYKCGYGYGHILIQKPDFHNAFFAN